MNPAPASVSLDRVLLALEEQRSALVSGSADALLAAGEELAQALGALREVKGMLTSADLDRLRQASAALSLDASLLGRAAAANQRALNTFFEPSSTYGLPGQSGLAAPSRTLRTA